MNCKDCKFWDKLHTQSYIGICETINLVYPKIYENFSELAAIDVIVDDNEKLEAGLMTREDFGCVKFINN